MKKFSFCVLFFGLTLLASTSLFANGTDIGPESIVQSTENGDYYVVVTCEGSAAVVRPLLIDHFQAIARSIPSALYLSGPIVKMKIKNLAVVEQEETHSIRKLSRVVIEFSSRGLQIRPIKESDVQPTEYNFLDALKFFLPLMIVSKL